MLIQKVAEVLLIDHVARSDDDILLRKLLNVREVVQIIGNVCIVNLILHMMVAVKQLQTVSLGVEIIIAAGSQMVGQSLRVLIQIDLDVLDPAV